MLHMWYAIWPKVCRHLMTIPLDAGWGVVCAGQFDFFFIFSLCFWLCAHRYCHVKAKTSPLKAQIISISPLLDLWWNSPAIIPQCSPHTFGQNNQRMSSVFRVVILHHICVFRSDLKMCHVQQYSSFQRFKQTHKDAVSYTFMLTSVCVLMSFCHFSTAFPSPNCAV